MGVQIDERTREIPVGHVGIGDRLLHNVQTLQVVQADRVTNLITLVCRVPDAPFDQLRYTDPDQLVQIERLPHAHRYFDDGPLTEEVVLKLIAYNGLIMQSNAGVYLAPSDYLPIEGEWLYGVNPHMMAHYDPTITWNEAHQLLGPLFGRQMRVRKVNGHLLAYLEPHDEERFAPLAEQHPYYVLGSNAAGQRWIKVSSLTITRS